MAFLSAGQTPRVPPSAFTVFPSQPGNDAVLLASSAFAAPAQIEASFPDQNESLAVFSQYTGHEQLRNTTQLFAPGENSQEQMNWELLQADLQDAVRLRDGAALQSSMSQLVNFGPQYFHIPQLVEQINIAKEEEVFWREMQRQERLQAKPNCNGIVDLTSFTDLTANEKELAAVLEKTEQLKNDYAAAQESYAHAVEEIAKKNLGHVPEVVFAMLAAQFETLGELSRTRDAYGKAVESAESVAAKQLFRLQALKTLSPQELAQHQPELEEMIDALNQAKPIAQEWFELEQKGNHISDVLMAYQLALASATSEEEMLEIGRLFSEQHGEKFDEFFLDPRVQSEAEMAALQAREKAVVPSAWQPVIDAFDPPKPIPAALQNDLPPGTPEQVALALSLAWNLRIQAELARKEPRLKRLDTLKDDFAQHLAERNKAPAISSLEAQILTYSTLLFTQAATAHLVGVVEASYLENEGDIGAAEKILSDYRRLAQNTEKLLDKIPYEDRSRLREKFAQLTWQVEVDGRNSLHQYTAAFEKGVRKVEELYGDTQVFRKQRDAYAKLYPEHFDAQTKKVLDGIDLTDTDKSKAAVLREAVLQLCMVMELIIFF